MAVPIRERYLSAVRAVNTLFVIPTSIVTMVAMFVPARVRVRVFGVPVQKRIGCSVSTGLQEHR